MKKIRLFAVLPIIVVVAITGCDKKDEVAPDPAPTFTVAETPSPVVHTHDPSSTKASKPREVTDDELQEVVKSYNEEVDSSNEKARKVIDSYNHQIESASK